MTTATQGPVFGQDPARAAWVAERLTGRWGHVTGIVPVGFEAYVRILHPAYDPDGRATRWNEVAESAGTQIHPLAQWSRLAREQPGRTPRWPGNDPEEGNLPAEALRLLLSVLRRHTATPDDCWFCLWEGYGWIHGSPSVSVVSFRQGAGTVREDSHVPPAYPIEWLDPARLVRHPGRNHLLGLGPLEAATDLGHRVNPDWFIAQSPNLCWPADRTWCFATEIDLDSTLVAGSDRLIAELLATAGLETWPVDPDDSLQDDADRVNL